MPGTPVSRERNKALLAMPARTARPMVCGMAATATPGVPWPRSPPGALSLGRPSSDDVRQQPQLACALDRLRQIALLLGGHRGDPPRHDLAALGHEALQQLDVLVVDLGRIRAGERAALAPPEERPADRDRGRLGGPATFAALSVSVGSVDHARLASVHSLGAS